jgi:hypothetical protein
MRSTLPRKSSLLIGFFAAFIILSSGIMLMIIFWVDIFTRPITFSDYYRKDIFNNIYYDATNGCLDICFGKTLKQLAQSDGNTFQALTIANPYDFGKPIVESGFAKDNKHVYFHERMISNVDLNTFSVIGFNLGKDKYHYYLYDSNLDDFINNEVKTEIHLPEGSMLVKSYLPDEYLIFQKQDIFYKLKLNPQPLELLKITSTEAVKFPPLE